MSNTTWIETVTTPPEPVGPPRMLATAEDFQRIQTWAATHSWAADRRQRILDRADGWPADHLAEFGRSTAALPPEEPPGVRPTSHGFPVVP